MKTREEIRNEIFALNKKYILLALPTGMGKSRAALDVTFVTNSLIPPQVLIVYPKLNLKQNWIDEIKKWGYEEMLPNITFTTYASLDKHVDKQWDMILFDEGHHITERVLDIIGVMKYQRAMVLSATVKNNLRYRLMAIMPGLYTYRVRMVDAIQSDILPEPRIILWPLTYKTTGKTETIVKNAKLDVPVKEVCFENRNFCRDRKYKYTIPCTEAQYALYLDEEVEWYKRKATGNQAMHNLWLHKAGERLKWLATQKTPYVLELLKKLETERTLTFCASIDQTEKVGKNCIHSKNKLAQDILDSFNNKEINHITACAMLDEGVNLASCRIGIFANINASERIQIQRVGRILRHPNPIIIIPYFVGSREQEIISAMLANYNKDLISVIKTPNDLTL